MAAKNNILNLSLSILAILLVAINLRPVITAVGPIIPDIGGDLSLSASQLGLLGALPIAVFGLASGFVQKLVGRFGVETTTAGALWLLTIATVWRSWPGPTANLWAGTALIGVAIAIGNVAVPIIVKQYFPKGIALMTSIYVAVLGVFAGLAAALAVPFAESSPYTWRLSLGVWALLTLIGALYWSYSALAERKRHANDTTTSDYVAPKVNLWKSPIAWQISAYMGIQSGFFYISLTWLPTVEMALGISAKTAGWHMFILQIGGVLGNLLAPILMRLGGNERFAAMLPGVLFVMTLLGFYFVPAGAAFWVAMMGFGTGTAFVVSLSLIALRASDITVAGHLSSMAQALGYGIAAVLLYITGLAQGAAAVGVLIVLGFIAIAILAAGFLAGRNVMIETPAPDEHKAESGQGAV